MTYIGTSHFVDRKAALDYYKEMGGYREVDSKLKEGLISIGKPVCEKDERLAINEERRYVKVVRD